MKLWEKLSSRWRHCTVFTLCSFFSLLVLFVLLCLHPSVNSNNCTDTGLQRVYILFSIIYRKCTELRFDGVSFPKRNLQYSSYEKWEKEKREKGGMLVPGTLQERGIYTSSPTTLARTLEMETITPRPCPRPCTEQCIWKQRVRITDPGFGNLISFSLSD